MSAVTLTTYRACSRGEKRALLHSFWSRRSHLDQKVLDAALEYGPVALWMVAIITVELAVCSLALIGQHQHLSAALAGAATVVSAWSTWWTRGCCTFAQHHHAVARLAPPVPQPDAPSS